MIRKAFAEIRTFYNKKSDRDVIEFCVLRVWDELRTPIARRRQEPEDEASTEVVVEDFAIVEEELVDHGPIHYTVSSASATEVSSESGAA